MTRRARVKVKTTPAVTRAQAAAEFNRKKTKLRRQQSHRRIAWISAGVICLLSTLTGGWMIHTGQFDSLATNASNHLWNLTSRAGFHLNQVTMTGRTHTDAEAVNAVLGIRQGDPILGISLRDMKQRLESVPEIKSASITRQLPGTIAIAVAERTPAAFWQNEGKISLIDREGVALKREHYHEKLDLPVVVGANAPKHMAELMALLASVPSLRPQVSAAIWVGDRRWNLQITRDITVMLPEEAPQAAWKRFANLVATKGLLSKSIRTVDMRMEDRVFITPIEEKKSQMILTNARDI